MNLKSITLTRSYFLSFFKALILIFLALFIFRPAFSSESSTFDKNNYQQGDKWLQTLNRIYKEVAELGSYGQDDFIKREFFMELDGNQENKEEHVLILEKRIGERKEMLIQVTYFKTIRKNSPIKYADQVKEIVCNFLPENIEMVKCNYDQSLVPSLLAKILNGIRQKKEYLKLIKK